MKQADILTIIRIANTFPGYDDELKNSFHSKAKTYLKELVNLLGLTKGTYEIRSNKAGIACLGEVTLHAENFYLQLGQSMTGEQFMYRHCNGMKDYTGGSNHWLDYNVLTNPDCVSDCVRGVIRLADKNFPLIAVSYKNLILVVNNLFL